MCGISALHPVRVSVDHAVAVLKHELWHFGMTFSSFMNDLSSSSLPVDPPPMTRSRALRSALIKLSLGRGEEEGGGGGGGGVAHGRFCADLQKAPAFRFDLSH